MFSLEGRCLCGGVRFEVTEPFDRVGMCHCASCKKISGGAGTVSGRVRTESIRILEGDDLLTRYHPDDGSAKTFCSRCGTNLFGGGWPDNPTTPVRLPTLVEPYDGKIEAHLFVRSLAPWESLPEDGSVHYEGRPPA